MGFEMNKNCNYDCFVTSKEFMNKDILNIKNLPNLPKNWKKKAEFFFEENPFDYSFVFEFFGIDENYSTIVEKEIGYTLEGFNYEKYLFRLLIDRFGEDVVTKISKIFLKHLIRNSEKILNKDYTGVWKAIYNIKDKYIFLGYFSESIRSFWN